MREFHNPVKRPADVLEMLGGSGDPAAESTLAHDTAHSLLHRIRKTADPKLVDAVIDYADVHGIDDVAELWSASAPDTLPGALWRLYLLRHAIVRAPQEAGYRFRRGLEVDTVGHAITGSHDAPTPDEVAELATTILRGAFAGDFADALQRAGGFARVMSAGSRDLAASEPEQSALDAELRHADGFGTLSEELARAAELWHRGRLT